MNMQAPSLVTICFDNINGIDNTIPDLQDKYNDYQELKQITNIYLFVRFCKCVNCIKLNYKLCTNCEKNNATIAFYNTFCDSCILSNKTKLKLVSSDNKIILKSQKYKY